MSVKVLVYTTSVPSDCVSKISARFVEEGMRVEFDQALQSDICKAAVVPVRLGIDHSDIPLYRDADLRSEFELSCKDFRYASPLSVDPAINQKLKSCSKLFTIRMHASHTSAFRVGMFFAVFLAECADGVVYSPRADEYFEPINALDRFSHEVANYERDLRPEDWRVVPFSGWS